MRACKDLCLDVEVLLVDVCSNSLNDAFVNCKRRSECHSRDVDLCLLLPAALVPAALRPANAAAQEGTMPSAMYPFEKLPIRTPNNAQIRDVLKGKLATGESLEVHETTLPPGGAPHAAHHHVHSEMWLIREGTVELAVNGTSYRLGPGSVGFVAFERRTRNQECGHNAGDVLCGGGGPRRRVLTKAETRRSVLRAE